MPVAFPYLVTTRTAMRCSRCQNENAPGSRFCSACGSALDRAAQAPAPEPVAESAAERRQLTILFCDLVGFTSLTEGLDPEDMRDLVGRYQARASAEIRRYDGFVAKLVGDGIMAYFGYPQAHEHDAERAVLAGLAIVAAVRSLAAPPGSTAPPDLQVRVGVATGAVVVGDMVGEDVSERWAVVGDTPNVAARLQGIAAPNSVVVGPRTRALAGGAFEYEALGEQRLKGLRAPLEVWRVVGRKAARSRFAATHRATPPPLVEREAELAVLEREWRSACAGAGRVVVIRGEAGIGKSRLVQAFAERREGEPYRRLDFQCSPYHADSALYPVKVYVEHAAGFAPGDDDAAKVAKLEALVRPFEDPQGDAVPLLAALLSIAPGERQPQLALEPRVQRERTLDVLFRQFRALALDAPLLCIGEDLQWIDPSSLDLLQRLVAAVPGWRALLIVATRPEFEAPWQPDSHVVELHPARLDDAGVRRMVANVVTDHGVPAGVIEQIVAKADGVPLFVEELAKAVQEALLLSQGASAAVRAPAGLEIPATLFDTLMARLDRLPQEKTLAQLAAVIGRSFGVDLLAAVAGVPQERLERSLERLTEAGLVRVQDAPARTFEFKHALIQDAAYQSQLRRTRRAHHEAIARALEERFPAAAAAQPEIVAHHYTEAGLIEPALASWLSAGTRAVAVCAFVEALRHFDRAARLLPRVVDAKARARLELRLQLGRGATLTAIEGFGTTTVARTYARALELCDEAGSDAQRFEAQLGAWRIALSQPDFGRAKALAEQLRERAARPGATDLALVAHGAQGITRFFLGEFGPAEAHFRQVRELFDPVAHRAIALRAGQDPVVTCSMWSALGMWLQGRAAEARAECERALVGARTLGHAFTLAYALRIAAMLEHLIGDLATLRERAAELERLTAAESFVQLGAAARILLGACGTEERGAASALVGIVQGVAEYRRVSGLNLPYALGLLGRAYARTGDVEQGLATIGEALSLVSATQERWYEAELLRLQGELLCLARGALDADARSAFERARAVARGQGAVWLEQRAAESLAAASREGVPVDSGR